MQGGVAVSMSRPHLTSLRCGTVAPCIPSRAGVVVTTDLDITTLMWAASRRPEVGVLLGVNIASAKARPRDISFLQGLALMYQQYRQREKKKKKINTCHLSDVGAS